LIAHNLRPLPGILARFVGIGKRRPYTFTADVLALWHVPGYAPPASSILTEVGPVHLTLAAHESVRAYSLPIIGWHGVFFVKERNTWTLTLVAFCFTLTLQFCHTPNIEKVDVAQLERRPF
jgi:hypothetical protein